MKMNKSIYSLLLSDNIISEIDKEAYKKGASRSAMINAILADYVSYKTPEQEISDIFKNIQTLIDGRRGFQIVNQPSSSMFSVKSALTYKYRPTAKYLVELYKGEGSVLGNLKVSFRTKSREFIDILNSFFVLWSKLEDKYISECFPSEKIDRSIGDGRFERTLILPYEEKYRTNEYIGRAIGEYINMFDSALKTYFENIGDYKLANSKVAELYISYLKKGIIIM